MSSAPLRRSTRQSTAAATKAAEEAASQLASLQLTESEPSSKVPTRSKTKKTTPRITLPSKDTEVSCEDIRTQIIRDKRKRIQVKLVIGESSKEDSKSRVKLLLQLKELQEIPPSAPKNKEMVPSTGVVYYMSGPIGAGKSYWYHKLFEETDIPHHLYNVDKYQEEFLKAKKLLQYQGSTTFSESEKQSMIARFMAKSVQCAKEDIGYYDKKEKQRYGGILTDNRETIVIDKPASSSLSLLKTDFIDHLEHLGYTQQYMFFIYRSLQEALEGNENRPRKLLSRIVKDSWIQSIENIPALKELFGENFYFINGSKETLSKEVQEKLGTSPIRTPEEVYALLQKNQKRSS